MDYRGEIEHNGIVKYILLNISYQRIFFNDHTFKNNSFLSEASPNCFDDKMS